MNTAPTPEEFDIWLENPITQFVVAGLRNMAVVVEERFRNKAWAGRFDPAEHAGCVALVHAYTDLAQITHADAVGANGMEIAPIDVENACAG